MEWVICVGVGVGVGCTVLLTVNSEAVGLGGALSPVLFCRVFAGVCFGVTKSHVRFFALSGWPGLVKLFHSIVVLHRCGLLASSLFDFPAQDVRHFLLSSPPPLLPSLYATLKPPPPAVSCVKSRAQAPPPPSMRHNWQMDSSDDERSSFSDSSQTSHRYRGGDRRRSSGGSGSIFASDDHHHHPGGSGGGGPTLGTATVDAVTGAVILPPSQRGFTPGLTAAEAIKLAKQNAVAAEARSMAAALGGNTAGGGVPSSPVAGGLVGTEGPPADGGFMHDDGKGSPSDEAVGGSWAEAISASEGGGGRSGRVSPGGGGA